MKLVPVEGDIQAGLVLYYLLMERPPEHNISHKHMPSFEEHMAFVKEHPYEAWYVIENDGVILGAIYLSKPPAAKSLPGNEIGIGLFKDHMGKGYGEEAARLLMQKHGKRRYIANSAPTNEASKKLWHKLGFSHVQETFASE